MLCRAVSIDEDSRVLDLGDGTPKLCLLSQSAKCHLDPPQPPYHKLPCQLYYIVICIRAYVHTLLFAPSSFQIPGLRCVPLRDEHPSL